MGSAQNETQKHFYKIPEEIGIEYNGATAQRRNGVTA
jgi:hypothetical protein